MVLRVDNLSRRFGTAIACERVTFEVQQGEVVALLGENGAGKSTLLSCIAGFITPDSGSVTVDGTRLRFGDPGGALRAGVGTAFQHFSLAPSLTVRESFELARLNAEEAMGQLPPELPTRGRIADLAVPERQQVEFLKARMLARTVLLLDEPTSLLGDTDVGRVLTNIRNVAESGVACVFVTHRLEEALEVADRIVVMRRGYIVDSETRTAFGWPDSIGKSLLASMFGEVDVTPRDEASESAEQRQEAMKRGRLRITGSLNEEFVALDIPRGRSLAIAGIAGNGQQGIVDLLTGVTATNVTITANEDDDPEELSGAALRRWCARNVTVVPEDRLHEGGSVAMSVGENLVLRDLASGRLSMAGLVRSARVKTRANALIGRWNIRPANPAIRLGTLSGGNVQRVILARSLDPLPEMLVAVRPTHGLDHHSVAMVRDQLAYAAGEGTTVVTIEQELDEALRHADYVAVMYRGGLSQIVPARDADRTELQRMMVSGWPA